MDSIVVSTLLVMAGLIAVGAVAVVVVHHRRKRRAEVTGGGNGTVDAATGPGRGRDPAATAPHPAAQTREVRGACQATRTLLSEAASTNDEAVVSSTTALVEHVAAQVARQLATTPIGSLRSLTSVSGIRLSAIGSAGYTNVAQVLWAGASRLQQVPGIGPASATQLLAAAGEVRETAFRRARIGFSTAEPSVEQDAALRALWRFASVRNDPDAEPSQFVAQASRLRRLGRSLWFPQFRVAWFVALPGRRHRWRDRISSAQEEVDRIVAGDVARQARLLLSDDRPSPTIEELWDWVGREPDLVKARLDECAQAILQPSTASSLLSRPRPRVPQRSLADAIALRVSQVPRPRAGFHAAPAPASGVDDTTALYRLYDASGRLLYVGISNNVHTRIRTHRVEKYWGPDVADARIEWFTTRAAALSAEATAIRRERPRHNVMHNG